jgi:hypothetical protein
MGLDLVVQHELQSRPRDLVLIDHVHPPLVDSLCRFNADLHVNLLKLAARNPS